MLFIFTKKLYKKIFFLQILDRLTVGDYREMITDVSYNTTTFMLKIKLIIFCEILTINVDE